jgi:hypothetical protein
MSNPIKLEVAASTTVSGWYTVKADDRLVGYVERASINAHGEGPEYIARYVRDGDIILHPEVFHGDFANVRALALILDRAKV